MDREERMSKDTTKSALVPKSWAAFTDALEEASTVIARKAIEAVQEVIEGERHGASAHFADALDSAPVYTRIADIAEREFKNSMLERFAIVEPGDDD